MCSPWLIFVPSSTWAGHISHLSGSRQLIYSAWFVLDTLLPFFFVQKELFHPALNTSQWTITWSAKLISEVCTKQYVDRKDFFIYAQDENKKRDNAQKTRATKSIKNLSFTHSVQYVLQNKKRNELHLWLEQQGFYPKISLVHDGVPPYILMPVCLTDWLLLEIFVTQYSLLMFLNVWGTVYFLASYFITLGNKYLWAASKYKWYIWNNNTALHVCDLVINHELLNCTS